MIALILNSIYTKNTKGCKQSYKQCNEEVDCDRYTVKQFFIHNYELNLFAGELSAKKINWQLLQAQNIVKKILIDHANATDVFIILNTHGKVGKHDLSDPFILKLIKLLSLNSIKILGLYALMCDAFNNTYYNQSDQYMSLHQDLSKLTTKTSSMQLLSNKINNLDTKIEQSFKIRGFNKAYDPKINKNEVLNLLNNTIAEEVSVTTKVFIYNEENILFFKSLNANQKQMQLPSFLNTLSLEVKRRKENIIMALTSECNIDVLTPNTKKLYNQVKTYNDGNNIDAVQQYLQCHNIWKKSTKFLTKDLNTTSKLNVFDKP